MSEPVEREVYVAWQDPDSRWIRPVGRLTQRVTDSATLYRFCYLRRASQQEYRLPGLPDLDRVYESEYLFAVFKNRQMPRQRPDYEDFLQRLALDVEADPFEVMARSNGRRETDRIEVFPPPERTPDEDLTALFFARGVRYLDGAAEAIQRLHPGARLRLVDDVANPMNPRALRISAPTGGHVGWVPDYFVATLHELQECNGDEAVRLTAEHINPPDSVLHMRLLCRLTTPWPDGFEPFSGPEFQPVVPDLAVDT